MEILCLQDGDLYLYSSFCCRGRMHGDSQSYGAERRGCAAGKGGTIKVSKANVLSGEVSTQLTMLYYASMVLYLALSTTLAIDTPRSLPPLFDRDPHDVQHPSFPPPSCSPALNRGFGISTTIDAIAAFCTFETGVVSTIHQQPISRTYNVIRLSLSWDNTGVCRRSQLSLSPIQNSGRSCETIFTNILFGCKWLKPVIRGKTLPPDRPLQYFAIQWRASYVELWELGVRFR